MPTHSLSDTVYGPDAWSSGYDNLLLAEAREGVLCDACQMGQEVTVNGGRSRAGRGRLKCSSGAVTAWVATHLRVLTKQSSLRRERGGDAGGIRTRVRQSPGGALPILDR